MSKVYVYAYKTGSHSASALAKALGTRTIKHERSKFKGNLGKTVINWGSGDLPPEVRRCKVVNPVEAVSCAGNKLSFFQRISRENPETRLVPWTSDQTAALKWLTTGSTVVVRGNLRGHSGSGITIVEPPSQSLPQAPLYTKYVPKKHEYRIHIMNGEVIDVQRKIRDSRDQPKDWKVRSHQNGFIYVRNDVRPDPDVTEQALRCFAASGLNFGGFDVIFNEKEKKAYVLEVNTAIGMENTTVTNYATAFKKHFLGGSRL